jgi:hypothetical protein
VLINAMQGLDGHCAAEITVNRLVHAAHAALADQADDFKIVHVVAGAKGARSPLDHGAWRRGLGWSERDWHLRRGRDGSGIGKAGARASRGAVWHWAILGDAIG